MEKRWHGVMREVEGRVNSKVCDEWNGRAIQGGQKVTEGPLLLRCSWKKGSEDQRRGEWRWRIVEEAMSEVFESAAQIKKEGKWWSEGFFFLFACFVCFTNLLEDAPWLPFHSLQMLLTLYQPCHARAPSPCVKQRPRPSSQNLVCVCISQ